MTLESGLEELFTREEELHPDLSRHVVDGPVGKMIKHPLHYELFFDPTHCGLVNAQYQEKLKLVREARDEKNWPRVIWLHERPYRLQAFIEVMDDLTDEQYWEELRQIWIDSENIWQNQDTWKDLLGSTRPGSFMSEEDQASFEQLPDTLLVYRGYQRGKNKSGLSYTLNSSRARWFSSRYSSAGNSRVRKLTVKKDDIFAYTNERGEEEIILLREPK